MTINEPSIQTATPTKTDSIGSLQRDLAFWQEQPFAAHQPRFGVEAESDDLVWLTDHGRRIALVHKPYSQLDLFEFAPGQPRLANPRLPPVYHAPTLLGVKSTLVEWIDWEQRRTSDTCDIHIAPDADHIRVTVRETWAARGMESARTFDLRVHPRFGYVLNFTNDVRATRRAWVEFNNFLAAGMSDHRPDKVRFPYVVWRHPTRGLLRWTSNHATVRTFGHLDAGDRRQIGRDGWIGLLGERDWNPVLALESSSQNCASVTCPNLLDEHVHFKGDPARDAEGRYVWRNRGRILSLPGAVADRLVNQAAPNDLDTRTAYPDRVGPAWQSEVPVDPAKPRNPQVCAFVPGQLCDFEKPIAHDACFRGLFFPATEDVEHWAMITTETARSGRRSLRLRVKAGENDRAITPMGSSLWLNAGRRYRLTAWVSYRGDAPAASAIRMSATQFHFTAADPLETVEAQTTGAQCRDWHKLELDFTARPHDPALGVQFHVQGAGAFYVDDVLLEEK